MSAIFGPAGNADSFPYKMCIRDSIASLASLISLKSYLKSPGARPGRYLLVFTAANVVGLAVLCLTAFLLPG